MSWTSAELRVLQGLERVHQVLMSASRSGVGVSPNATCTEVRQQDADPTILMCILKSQDVSLKYIGRVLA